MKFSPIHVRGFIPALLAALCGSASLLLAQEERAALPNIVIFLTDDQGTNDASCYGAEDLHTPAMDELARTGIRFTQAYAHTVCCPARALLLTGRHPQRSGIVHWTQGSRKPNEGNPQGTNLPREEVTLAEVLQDAGYHTGLFGKWHLGAREGHGPIDQGFERFYGHLGGFIDNYRHHFLHGKGFHDLYDQKQEIFREGQYFPDLMTAQAINFIKEHRDEPFFALVAYNIPHYPEQADPQFDDRYADLPMPRRAYAKMISTTDDRMGQILAVLKELELRKNTIILFLSDNGHSAEDGARIRGNDHSSGLPEGTYYHAYGGGGDTGNWRGHKGTYYEGGLRVPAILSAPALIAGGSVRSQAVIAADWFPTLLELCQLPLPESVVLDGKSLKPLLEAPQQASPHTSLHWAWAQGWAVREGPWKLIGNGEKARELVNLDDPMPERINHLERQPDRAASLLKQHKEWLRRTMP